MIQHLFEPGDAPITGLARLRTGLPDTEIRAAQTLRTAPRAICSDLYKQRPLTLCVPNWDRIALWPVIPNEKNLFPDRP